MMIFIAVWPHFGVIAQNTLIIREQSTSSFGRNHTYY